MRNTLNVFLIALFIVAVTASNLKSGWPWNRNNNNNNNNNKNIVNYENNYFEGYWRATGYGCWGGAVKEQEIYGEIYKGEIILHKIIGDSCVTSGNISVRASAPSQISSAGISCTWTTGNKNNPNSSSTTNNCSIRIQDQNTFKNGRVTYVRLTDNNRVGGENYRNGVVLDEYPYEYFLGYWKGYGYGCGWSKNIKEDVSISYVNGEFQATKINGDDCVNSGHITYKHSLQSEGTPFRSQRKNDWNLNNGTITLGSKWKPQSNTRNGVKFNIISTNYFTIPNWNLSFERGAYDNHDTNTYNLDYFKGNWKGENYKCGGDSNLTQTISISYNNFLFIATMQDGNNCSPKDSVSFDGFLVRPNWWKYHNEIWMIGCRLYSNDNRTNCYIQIVDDDTFKLFPGEMTYTREKEEKEEKVGA